MAIRLLDLTATVVTLPGAAAPADGVDEYLVHCPVCGFELVLLFDPDRHGIMEVDTVLPSRLAAPWSGIDGSPVDRCPCCRVTLSDEVLAAGAETDAPRAAHWYVFLPGDCVRLRRDFRLPSRQDKGGEVLIQKGLRAEVVQNFWTTGPRYHVRLAGPVWGYTDLLINEDDLEWAG